LSWLYVGVVDALDIPEWVGEDLMWRSPAGCCCGSHPREAGGSALPAPEAVTRLLPSRNFIYCAWLWLRWHHLITIAYYYSNNNLPVLPLNVVGLVFYAKRGYHVNIVL